MQNLIATVIYGDPAAAKYADAINQTTGAFPKNVSVFHQAVGHIACGRPGLVVNWKSRGGFASAAIAPLFGHVHHPSGFLSGAVFT